MELGVLLLENWQKIIDIGPFIAIFSYYNLYNDA
jgi:hypothetical protein